MFVLHIEYIFIIWLLVLVELDVIRFMLESLHYFSITCKCEIQQIIRNVEVKKYDTKCESAVTAGDCHYQ